MKRRHFTALGIGPLLTGCSTVPEMQANLPFSGLPNPGHGLLVTRFIRYDESDLTDGCQLNMAVAAMQGQKPSRFFLNAPLGEYLHVVEVMAGRYRWETLFIGNTVSYFGNEMTFQVRELAACYVGDVHFSINWRKESYRMGIRDSSRIASNQFQVGWPASFAALPFITDIPEKPKAY